MIHTLLAAAAMAAVLHGTAVPPADPAPVAKPPPPAAVKDESRDSLRDMQQAIDRIVSPRGIDEARFITLGGARQWITIRGQDRDAPVLLFLHGGPGGALSDISFLFQRPWEDYFTVVQWDQRGFGRSGVDGGKLKGTLNLEQYVSDAVELIEQLQRQFGGRRVVLMGQSWGTLLSLEIAHRRPDLLYAVVNIGQLVDERRNFEETRRLLINNARQRGDAPLLKTLEALGPMPNVKDWEAWGAWVGAVQWPMVGSGHSWHNSVDPEGWNSRILAARLISPRIVDPLPATGSDFPGGAAAKQKEINTDIGDWSAEKRVGHTFSVPVVVIAGSYDWQTPITLARDYYDTICAPYKVFVEFPNSAHVVHAEEPGRMMVTLFEDVLPAVRGDVPKGAVRCDRATWAGRTAR